MQAMEEDAEVSAQSWFYFPRVANLVCRHRPSYPLFHQLDQCLKLPVAWGNSFMERLYFIEICHEDEIFCCILLHSFEFVIVMGWICFFSILLCHQFLSTEKRMAYALYFISEKYLHYWYMYWAWNLIIIIAHHATRHPRNENERLLIWIP